MAVPWFVKLGETVKGPISAAELRQMALAGVVTPEMPVRRGESRWVRAAKVQGLFEPKPGERPSSEPEAESEEPENPFVRAAEGDQYSEPEPDSEPAGPAAALEPHAPDPLAALGLASREAPSAPQPPASAERTPAEPAGGDAESPLAFGLKIEESTTLREGTPPIVSEARAKVDGPETPEEKLAQADAATRRAYLQYEGLVKSLGTFFLLNGLIAAAATAFWAVLTLGQVAEIEDPERLNAFHVSTWLTGFGLLVAVGGCITLGTGLRRLAAWGRWATITVLIQAVLYSVALLVALAIRGEADAWPAALGLLVGGLGVPSLFTIQLLGSEGDTVCSAAYLKLLRATRGLRPRFNLSVALVLVVELGALGAVVYRQATRPGVEPAPAATAVEPEAAPEPETVPDPEPATEAMPSEEP